MKILANFVCVWTASWVHPCTIYNIYNLFTKYLQTYFTGKYECLILDTKGEGVVSPSHGGDFLEICTKYRLFCVCIIKTKLTSTLAGWFFAKQRRIQDLWKGGGGGGGRESKFLDAAPENNKNRQKKQWIGRKKGGAAADSAPPPPGSATG